MDTQIHDMTNLFSQLGLPADDKSINQFLGAHYLDDTMKLTDAPFFNTGQKSFISESIEQDSDWCEMIDQMDVRLRSAH